MRVMKIQGANAALMIGLSLYLVPRWGVTGAALASAITVATTNLWSLVAVRRTLKLFPYHAGYFKLALPALVTTGVLVALMHASAVGYSHWKMALLALVCAYVSFGGTLMMFGLDGEDCQIARMAWTRITQGWRRDEVSL